MIYATAPVGSISLRVPNENRELGCIMQEVLSCYSNLVNEPYHRMPYHRILVALRDSVHQGKVKVMIPRIAWYEVRIVLSEASERSERAA